MSSTRILPAVLCAALAACAACAAHDDDVTPPAPPTPPSPDLAGPHPAPGIDLPDDLALPARTAPGVHRAAAPGAALALVADRALLAADVPTPPRGGAIAFELPDERAAWVTAIPDGVQLPAAAYGDGHIYISGGFESVTFYALDAQTGHIDWATSHLEDNGPTAAVYDRGRVLFNTESCTLFALDAKTGKRLWHRFLGDPTLAQIAVADGLVYAAHPASGGQELTAYHEATGDAVWTRVVGSELLAAPVIAGDAIYASTVGGVTFAFDRATGAQRWAKSLHATTAPWVTGDELYLTRRDGAREQQIVVAAATGALVRTHATTTVADDVPASVESWKSVWAFEGSRPVVDRGIRYDAIGGEIHASDAATGDLLWARRDGDAKTVRDLGSVAFAGSAVVVATRAGKVFGLDVDTGYTLWSYDLGHRVIAEPVIAKGWIYVTTEDGYVIGLHVADDTLDGWHMFGGNPQHDGPVARDAI
jgi:outer membrane protein assembly factor BamB